MKEKIKSFAKGHKAGLILGVAGPLLCGISYISYKRGCTNTLNVVKKGLDKAMEADDSWVVPLWEAIEQVNKQL